MAIFVDENSKEREDVFSEDMIVRSFNATIEQSDSRIFGLIGDWESGKTTFIKFWEDYIKNEKKNEYSNIHVDAFSKDYVKDPFSMLFDAFKDFMCENKISLDFAKPFVEKAKQIGIAAFKSVAFALAQKLSDGMAHDIYEKFLDEYQYNPQQREDDPCEDLRKEIRKIINITKKKLYIVIDELTDAGLILP